MMISRLPSLELLCLLYLVVFDELKAKLHLKFFLHLADTDIDLQLLELSICQGSALSNLYTNNL